MFMILNILSMLLATIVLTNLVLYIVKKKSFLSTNVEQSAIVVLIAISTSLVLLSVTLVQAISNAIVAIVWGFNLYGQYYRETK